MRKTPSPDDLNYPIHKICILTKIMVKDVDFKRVLAYNFS